METPELNQTVGLDAIVAPELVRAAGGTPRAVWRNAIGGITFDLGDGRFAKWLAAGGGYGLGRESARLAWLPGRHPAPELLADEEDADGRVLVTRALAGRSAVEPEWIARPEPAVKAIADGLRAIHAVPLDGVPDEWAGVPWFDRHHGEAGERPDVAHPVLVHGDACAPNTLLDADGRFTAHVDVGSLGIGDAWADLAIASMSLDWNYGAGWQDVFFEAYGVARDEERIAYYRALWDLEP